MILSSTLNTRGFINDQATINHVLVDPEPSTKTVAAPPMMLRELKII
jgi:hypothetical protein